MSSDTLRPLLRACLPSSGISEENLAAHWLQVPSSDLACELSSLLEDVDALVAECAELFWGSEIVTDGKRMPCAQLYSLTQRLIYCLGSRDEEVLARIAQVFSASVAGAVREGGVGIVEFQGYVAAVLTQVLRELEARAADESSACVEHVPGTFVAAGPLHTQAWEAGADAVCGETSETGRIIGRYTEIADAHKDKEFSASTAEAVAPASSSEVTFANTYIDNHELVVQAVEDIEAGAATREDAALTSPSWFQRVADTVLSRFDTAADNLDSAFAATELLPEKSRIVATESCPSAASSIIASNFDGSVGDDCIVKGRAGKIIWDGRPKHKYVKLRWLDDPEAPATLVSAAKLQPPSTTIDAGRFEGNLQPASRPLFRASPHAGPHRFGSEPLLGQGQASLKLMDTGSHQQGSCWRGDGGTDGLTSTTWETFAFDANPGAAVPRIVPHASNANHGAAALCGFAAGCAQTSSCHVSTLQESGAGHVFAPPMLQATLGALHGDAALSAPSLGIHSSLEAFHVAEEFTAAGMQDGLHMAEQDWSDHVAAEAQELLERDGLPAYAARGENWLPKRLLFDSRHLYVADDVAGISSMSSLLAESPYFAMSDIDRITRYAVPGKHMLSLHFDSGVLVLRFSYLAFRDTFLAALLASNRRLPVVEAVEAPIPSWGHYT